MVQRLSAHRGRTTKRQIDSSDRPAVANVRCKDLDLSHWHVAVGLEVIGKLAEALGSKPAELVRLPRRRTG